MNVTTKNKSHNVWIITVSLILTAMCNWLGVTITDEYLAQVAQVAGPLVGAVAVAVWNMLFTEGGVRDGKEKQEKPAE